MKRFMAVMLAAAMLLIPAACGAAPAQTPATRQIIAMDTAMSFTAYGERGSDAVQAAVEEVQRLEKLLSRTDPDSEISRLNTSGAQPMAVDGEVCRLLETASAYTAATGGAFDVTIAPAVDAWGFTSDNRQLPAPAELEALLGRVGPEHIAFLSESTVRLDPGTKIDLGGIAKGYASDRLSEIFAEMGVKQGWFSLGGNVLAWGGRPDGAPWLVGIQDPKHPDQEAFVGTLGLDNAYAVTSGGYQRYFEQDGVIYHHILDPATGYPADSGLTSVTVVAERSDGSGAMCDALSTALFVMGEAQALDFWRSSEAAFDLVLVTSDDRVLVTGGLVDAFTAAEGSGYAYETVS